MQMQLDTAHQRHIGIEIEVESTAISGSTVAGQLSNNDMWQYDTEGSLRAGTLGWEVKTRGHAGQPAHQVMQRMTDLYPLLQYSSGTWRAAVHVHVDVSDLSSSTKALLYSFLYCVDDSIFERFAPDRRESNFCVPLANDVERTLGVVAGYRSSLGADTCKYTSVNAQSDRTFGTFEFRHMQTPAVTGSVQSVTDALKEIELFANVCVSLVQWVVVKTRTGFDTFPALVEEFGETAIGNRCTLKLSQEAILNVLDRFHIGVPTLPPEVDSLSLYKVVPRRHHQRPPSLRDRIAEEFAQVPLPPEEVEEIVGLVEIAESIEEMA